MIKISKNDSITIGLIAAVAFATSLLTIQNAISALPDLSLWIFNFLTVGFVASTTIAATAVSILYYANKKEIEASLKKLIKREE